MVGVEPRSSLGIINADQGTEDPYLVASVFTWLSEF